KIVVGGQVARRRRDAAGLRRGGHGENSGRRGETGASARAPQGAGLAVPPCGIAQRPGRRVEPGGGGGGADRRGGRGVAGGTRALSELPGDLVAAFDRFMIEPEESDKRCRAKIAIVETLNKIEYDRDDVFLRGIRHVQMEPVWGKSEDSAGHLRGAAAFGLV